MDTVFQFTPLREGRRVDTAHKSSYNISIHAPPRGATGINKPDARVHRFQFTPLREGRRGAFCGIGTQSRFQFTPLREGRRMGNCVSRGDAGKFQFTPLREGRRPRRDAPLKPQISIHAPPRGATRIRQQHAALSGAFQFTPLREGRPFFLYLVSRVPLISIHAPPRGATTSARVHADFRRISIHAPPRGATLTQ